MTPRVWNQRDRHIPREAIYVGRPSPWGNPFRMPEDGTRADVIAKFREGLLAMRTSDPPKFHALVRPLIGRHLVCWCAPQSCHADVWLELAAQEAART